MKSAGKRKKESERLNRETLTHTTPTNIGRHSSRKTHKYVQGKTHTFTLRGTHTYSGWYAHTRGHMQMHTATFWKIQVHTEEETHTHVWLHSPLSGQMHAHTHLIHGGRYINIYTLTDEVRNTHNRTHIHTVHSHKQRYTQRSRQKGRVRERHKILE